MASPLTGSTAEPGLAAIIRSARRQMGWTQRDLADRVGVALASVGRWERGSTSPQIHLLPTLARALQIDEDLLRSFKAAPTTPPSDDNVVRLAQVVDHPTVDLQRSLDDRRTRFIDSVLTGIRDGHASDPIWSQNVANLARVLKVPWEPLRVGEPAGDHR